MVSEPYHLLHFLAFFSYFVIRTSAAQILSPQITHPLFLREIQAALALGVFAAIKVSIYFFNFSLKSLLILFHLLAFVCDRSSGKKLGRLLFQIRSSLLRYNLLWKTKQTITMGMSVFNMKFICLISDFSSCPHFNNGLPLDSLVYSDIYRCLSFSIFLSALLLHVLIQMQHLLGFLFFTAVIYIFTQQPAFKKLGNQEILIFLHY